MSQDARIDGIDAYDFAMDFPDRFSPTLRQVPWDRCSDQRASFYGCRQALLFPFWFAYRLAVAGLRREAVIPLPNGGAERLTVRHLAAVLDRGEWFDPQP